ncbi:MAG: succinylglutamate desuccinylase/aspartoacylase family protein [Saprospiraceae bacterium]|nr:succinylglutamate desuccinylase/aspartoacylase family protein [Saprospiraceae bacterium]
MSSINTNKRHIIGRYIGEEPGPLLICTAGMHGNEPAGVEALKTVFTLLEREPSVNLDFKYKGRLLGLIGNWRAYSQGKRFIVKDLNRQWTTENVERIRNTDSSQLDSEDRDLLEILNLVEAEIAACKPTHVVLLDLHTTSAGGGIFAIATDEQESIRIATGLHAPVITGLMRGIRGTTLHYFSTENFPVPIAAAAFEAGQHEDPVSVNRSIAAIINCMRSIEAVKPEDVENRHDEILVEYSKNLPKIAEIINVHPIKTDDCFRMKPGYQNFQSVVKGELLAQDRHGEIRSPADALILMPLYQPQGSDGFFLVKAVNSPIYQ